MMEVELVDTAEIPGGGRLYLMQSGSDFSIQFGEDELMGSQDFASEKALAQLACQRMVQQPDRVLIGGLGMGFTLGATLSALPESTTIVVAELVPKVVAWAHGPLTHLFGRSLSDPRVSLEIRDVHDVIVEARASFDGILLDVDNGPDGLIQDANDRLYCNWGLRAAYGALRPAGVLAIWSAYEDDAFVDRLQKAGFEVDAVVLAATGGRARTPYTIWLASKPG